MAKTLVGIFDDKKPAQSTVNELRRLGLAQEHVRLLDSSDREAWGDGSRDAGNDNDGWMDRVRSWFSSITGDDADRDHADRYSEAFRRGHHIVVADVEENMVDEGVATMLRHGAVDIDRRADLWKQQGYTGFDRSARPYTAEERDRELASQRTAQQGGQVAVPVVEEQVSIGKRVVQRGGVRIHSHVQERPVQEVVRLREERLNVQRRPVNRPATEADLAFQERTVDVTAMGEEAVVGKTAHVVEEVVVAKTVGEREQTVKETVRRTDVDVQEADRGADKGTGTRGRR